jgi:hypothetical protein
MEQYAKKRSCDDIIVTADMRSGKFMYGFMKDARHWMISLTLK